MKYVYAALVAVSLVACGGTEEGALGPKEARSGAVTSPLDIVTSTTWCQGSIPPNNAQRVLRFVKDPDNVWNGNLDEYIIRTGAETPGYCDGPTRRTWCGCVITGDKIIAGFTGGLQDDGTTLPYSFVSYMPLNNNSSTCPNPMPTSPPTGTAIKVFSSVQNGVTYYSLGINCDASNNCQYKWGERTPDTACHVV